MSGPTIRNERELAEYLSRPKRILLVEDDAAVRELFIRFCRAYNCQVDEAADGEHALALVQAVAYDVILLDIKLPGMDGPLFFRELKAHGNKAPVVFVSGYLDGEVIGNINRIGFACFVMKPPTYNDEFAHNLMSVLGVRRIDPRATFSLKGWGEPVAV